MELVEARKRLALMVTRLEYRLVDAVVVYSDFMARRVDERYAVPRESLRVVRHGIDLSTFNPARAVPERVDDQFRIGFIGRIVNAHKGVDCLIRAISRLPKHEASGVRVLVAGDGPDRVANEHLARGLGLNRQLEFLGWCDDVASLLGTLDLLVVPSRSEPFGLVAIEALAMGVRVVAFDTGGLREIGRGCKDVTLVPPGDIDAMAAAISERIRKDERGPSTEAHRFVRERFDVRECAATMQDVYRDVVQRR